MSPDPFHILGLSPDSTPADWKRAYRRLAMRWHPDRSTHPEATERFKQISAAYEQLLSTVDPVEMAENRASTAETAKSRAADIRLHIEITLEEGALGCRKTIRYQRGHPCPTCAGSGEAGMARTRFCQACHGSGRIRDAERVLIPCDACKGRGFFTERICPDCAGSGRDCAEVVLEINVPPGMLSGDELRLAGQGEPGDGQLLPGDLYLTVELATHGLYRLQGRDIHYRMPVSALALLAGAEIELPTPWSSLRHTLEPGPTATREVRLSGRGYPGRGNRPAGDLVVVLDAVVPARLDSTQRLRLLKINNELIAQGEEVFPELHAWRHEHGLTGR